MATPLIPEFDVTEVVPFLHVMDVQASVSFYQTLGFHIRWRWEPEGELRWCWMTLGKASVMIQSANGEPAPPGRISLYFICSDAIAIYKHAISKGIAAAEPQVGNSMWVTSMKDPNGNEIVFESYTDAFEETKLSDTTSPA